MSVIKVALEDETGGMLEEVQGRTWLLGRLLSVPSVASPDFPILRTIDLYGDTTFNRLQVGLLLEEWSRLQQWAETDEERQLLLDVETLAEKCKSKPGRYLKFYGD
jgi:hypothetical protein